ncbi:glucose 1-dehydrogenase [Siminovitchia terrae]|uniref:Glucose 1-dehydrogenase n=1 Tax=Siminovitchia terrae TaxID=1914933 RepID=A0A429XFR7_SIMTE|nr:glucose 1-dehydrogenase [Siminovitchia terrae]RST61733.1 glucose 1-dehydrogenase [Siminovitchia terrae]
MKLFSLEGKTAIVTGGGRGLGRSMALALAEAGADVAVTSRSENELVEVSKEIESYGRKSFYEALDIQNKNDFSSFVSNVNKEQGSVDILVNAAGLNVRRSFLDFTEEEWDFVMDVNLKGTMFACQAVIPYMKKQNSGRIINVASLSSVLGFKDMAAYAASKGAVSQLTKAMAVEFAENGINVNAIGPGYFSTKMTAPVFKDEQKNEWMMMRTPMKRTGTDQDLKGAAIFLASEASNFMTGQTLYIDGGWLVSA